MTQDQSVDGGGEDKMTVAVRRMEQNKKNGTVPDDEVDDPTDPYQVAGYFANAFIQDAKQLRLKIADAPPQQMPRATDHIDAMQQMIVKLIERGPRLSGLGRGGLLQRCQFPFIRGSKRQYA